MAKQVKLTVKECLDLSLELDTLNTEDSVTFAAKYDVVKLLEKVRPIKKRFEDQKLEIYKKYGNEDEDDDGEKVFSLTDAKEKDVAIKELEALLEKKETFSEILSFEDLKDLKSNRPYFHVMKFVSKE